MSTSMISLNSEIDALNEAENIIKIVFQEHCTEMATDICLYSPDSFGDLLKLKTHMTRLAETQKEINAIIAGVNEINSTDRANLTEEETKIKFEETMRDYMEGNDIDDDQKEIISGLNSFINGEPVEPEAEIADEDGELIMTKDIDSYKDPLTQCTMKNPVKSKICKHAYEKESIIAYLGESRKICPYSGCQCVLGRKDLVEHFALKMKLLVENEEI